MKEEIRFHKINDVSPLKNYELSVHFWDGSTKIYDVKPWFKKQPVFRTIKNKGLFEQVKVDIGGYGISWNDEVDLSCNALWEGGREVKTPFDGILSFGDASIIWKLSESTLRKAVSYGKFVRGVDVCKYGKQWLISVSAMKRVYGEPRLT